MAKIIVVSKLGKKRGQTLFAAHLATFLAASHQTALVDFFPENHCLENFVAKRHFFNLKYHQNLPVPTYFEGQKSLLSKISTDFEFVVVDNKEEYFLEHADIVLTLLSEKESISNVITKNSAFSNMLWQAKMSRAKTGKNAFRHVLILNDLFEAEEIRNLQKNASLMGYVVAPCLKQNSSYVVGLKEGITVLDKDVPCLLKNFNEDDFFARRNLKQILEFIWSDK